MNKKISAATVGIFAALLILMNLTFLLLPDREFSENENRYLAALPQFSVSRLFSGDWMQDMEEYVSDQFPLRDRWIVLQSALHRAAGRQDNNGVYYGDSLTETFWTVDEALLNRKLSALENMARQLDIPVCFVPVPNAVAVNEAELPALAPDLDQSEIIGRMQEQLSSVQTVDLLPTLQMASAETQLYYRTDHHMTTAGAYLVYSQMMRALGVEPMGEEAFARVSVTDSFCGTLYRKSGAWWTEADTIERWDPKESYGVTLELPRSHVTYDSLYQDSALATADKYSYFLYGNQPLDVIRSEAPEAEGKVLVVKDSYANEVLPFLAAHFREIHVIDPRYYVGSVSSYAKEGGFDRVIVLYNIKNYCESTEILQ